jgi:hypothetical protein
MTEAEKLKVATAFADPRVKEAVAILREHNAHARKTFALTDQVVAWVRKNVWRDLS